MAEHNELSQSSEDLAKAVGAYLDKCRAILKKLEIPGGPRVGVEHLEICVLPSELTFKTKGDARIAAKALDQSINKLKLLKAEVRKLPSSVITRMAAYSDIIIPDPDEDDEPDLLPRREEHRSFEKLLDALELELKAEAKRVEQDIERHWSGRGKGADWEARDIAVKIAKLYMRLRNEEPAFGIDPITDKPSTHYAIAVQEILHLMGIKTGCRMPCNYAIGLIKRGKI